MIGAIDRIQLWSPEMRPRPRRWIRRRWRRARCWVLTLPGGSRRLTKDLDREQGVPVWKADAFSGRDRFAARSLFGTDSVWRDDAPAGVAAETVDARRWSWRQLHRRTLGGQARGGDLESARGRRRLGIDRDVTAWNARRRGWRCCLAKVLVHGAHGELRCLAKRTGLRQWTVCCWIWACHPISSTRLDEGSASI